MKLIDVEGNGEGKALSKAPLLFLLSSAWVTGNVSPLETISWIIGLAEQTVGNRLSLSRCPNLSSGKPSVLASPQRPTIEIVEHAIRTFVVD